MSAKISQATALSWTEENHCTSITGQSLHAPELHNPANEQEILTTSPWIQSYFKVTTS